jgi:uridine kinase
MAWSRIFSELVRCRRTGPASVSSWHLEPPISPLFITNRLSSDGVAVVTELQSRACKAVKDWGTPTIITGAVDNLWSGSTGVVLIPELAIPEPISESLFSDQPVDETTQARLLLEKAERISAEVLTVVAKTGANLLVAQNTNALPYNLAAALGIVLGSERAGIPVVHQTFDFYWQHETQNRVRFAHIRKRRQAFELLEVLAQWTSPLWRFATPNHAFREICIKHGLAPDKFTVVRTPVVPPTGRQGALSEFLGSCNWIRNRIDLRHPCLLGHSKDFGRQKPLALLFPSKLSRGKNIPETIRSCVLALVSLGITTPLRLIVTGALYDMEVAAGILQLTAQFEELSAWLDEKVSCGKLVGWEMVLLNGTPRFEQPKEMLSMDELYAEADLVVFGSKLETDCIGMFEAMLARKPCWIRPWEGEQRAIFDEVTEGLVVGVLGETGSQIFDPTDVRYTVAATEHNARVIEERYSIDRFAQQISVTTMTEPARPADIDVTAIRLIEFCESVERADEQKIRIICLAGTAGAGKSSIAEAMVAIWQLRGRRSTTISLDDFVDEAACVGDEGYSAASIKVGELLTVLNKLCRGEPVVVPRYYHGVAMRGKRLAFADSWIIVEGVYALTPSGSGSDGGQYEHLQEIASRRAFITGGNAALRRCLKSDCRRRFDAGRMLSRYRARTRQASEIQSHASHADLIVYCEGE